MNFNDTAMPLIQIYSLNLMGIYVSRFNVGDKSNIYATLMQLLM